LDVVSKSIPAILDSFQTFRAFSSARAEDVLGKLRARASKFEVRTLASTVFLNRGDRFVAKELPPEAQWSPAFGIAVADFDSDGFEDLFLSQNFFSVRPEMQRHDAVVAFFCTATGRHTESSRIGNYYLRRAARHRRLRL
jgi:hypothetical protein